VRPLSIAVSFAAVAVLAAGCGGGQQQSSPGSSTTSKTSTSSAPPPGAELDPLLLTPAEVDAAMGVTGMTIRQRGDVMSDDSDKKWPSECLYAFAPVERPVYDGSGYTAMRAQFDAAPAKNANDSAAPAATQAVVSFPSADGANVFFANSSQRWGACADREFTAPGEKPEDPPIAWHVGPMSVTESMLSTTAKVTMATQGITVVGTCQRALTVRKNIAIDIQTCSNDPGDSAVKIANQIAAKIDKT
jgi:hypothetical protein